MRKESDESKNRYFAFISYNRKNLDIAEFVQNMLEHYRYPKESIEEKLWPEDPAYVREIFLDKSYLSGRGDKFEEQIEAALANSRYLIVICSPEAAALKHGVSKHYVNWEIETFLRIHGEGALSRVIPVIYKGEPDLSEESCLPVPIRLESVICRNLPDMRPTANQKVTFLNRKQLYYSAVITLLTYVFDVERSIIYDRFESERARTRTRIILASAAALLLFAAAGTWFILERNRAWVETERNKAEAVKNKAEAEAYRLRSEAADNQKKDAEAMITYNQALNILKDPRGNSGAALLYLAHSWRLPEARRRANLLLQQQSWLVPVEILPGELMPKTNLSLPDFSKPVELKQNVPEKFPLRFEQKFNVISAILKKDNKLIFQKSDCFAIHSLNVSPDGRTLVLLKMLPYEIAVYDAFSGKELWKKSLENMPKTMAFSPDGLRCAVLTQDSALRIFRNDNGSEQFLYCKVPENTWKLRFSDDSSSIFAVSWEKTVKYDLLQQFNEVPVLSNWNHPMTAAAISADRKYLYLVVQTSVALSDSTLLVCDTSNMKVLQSINLSGYAWRITVSPDGKYIAVLDDRNITVFDHTARELKQILRQTFPGRPEHVVFDRSSRQCFISGETFGVWVWKKETGKCQQTEIGASEGILDIGMDPANSLVTLGKTLVFRDTETLKKIKEIPLDSRFEKMVIGYRCIVLGTRLSRKVQVMARSGKILWKTKAYAEPGVIPFCLDESSGMLAVATSRNTAQCFDVENGEPITETIPFDSQIYTLSIEKRANGNESYLLLGGGGTDHGRYLIYDINARDEIYRNIMGNARIEYFLPIRDQTVFASGNSNSRHFIFKLPSPAELTQQEITRFAEGYVGVKLNSYGIISHDSRIPLDISGSKKLFPQTSLLPGKRFVVPGMTEDLIGKELSNRDFPSAVEALHRYGGSLSAMQNYWFRIARQLAEKNHSLRSPGKSADQLKSERTGFSYTEWGNFIFTDPQAEFFADYFTDLMMKLHPEALEALEERSVYLRYKGKEPEVFAEKRRQLIKLKWKKLVGNPEAAGVHDFYGLALTYMQNSCKTVPELRQFLNELFSLLTGNKNCGSMNSDAVYTVSDLAGSVAVFAGKLPEGEKITAEFLAKLIAGLQNVNPEGSRKILMYQLNLLALKHHIASGNKAGAKIALEKAEEFSGSSAIGAVTLQIPMILYQVLNGDSAGAKNLWSSFVAMLNRTNQGQHLLKFAGELWLGLEQMHRKGIPLGEMEVYRKTFEVYCNKGTPIKVGKDSPAEKLGWKTYDTIVELDGNIVRNQRDLAACFFALDLQTQGKKVKIKLKRNGKVTEYEIISGKKLGIAY